MGFHNCFWGFLKFGYFYSNFLETLIVIRAFVNRNLYIHRKSCCVIVFWFVPDRPWEQLFRTLLLSNFQESKVLRKSFRLWADLFQFLKLKNIFVFCKNAKFLSWSELTSIKIQSNVYNALYIYFFLGGGGTFVGPFWSWIVYYGVIIIKWILFKDQTNIVHQ